VICEKCKWCKYENGMWGLCSKAKVYKTVQLDDSRPCFEVELTGNEQSKNVRRIGDENH